MTITLEKSNIVWIKSIITRGLLPMIIIALTGLSIFCFWFFYQNHLGLAYNDARSHLNISRRVVEGLKPGFAQLGSVWLPLPHVLMVVTIWNDMMWHTGLAGAIISMISFVVTGVVIYLLLKAIGVGAAGRLFGVAIFALNLNILYLQSTAMTELLLLVTMTLGSYELIRWHQEEKIVFLMRSSFWIMLSTLVRYDGWFLFLMAAVLVVLHAWQKSGYKMSEGLFFLFATLGGLGIVLWVLWNTVIFHDPLYFAFGPYSAHAQQNQLDQAGVLQTKHHIWLSIKMYWYAMVYNSGAYMVIIGIIGAVVVWLDKRLPEKLRFALLILISPLLFNIIALYLGHSVLFIQGLSGNTWFNVRYGIMMMPSIAVFAGYLFDRVKITRSLLLGLFLFAVVFQFLNFDAVTIDDGRVGASQKNVSEVSGWLAHHAADREGFVLISAASHDAIIFSSGMPMKKFIHEGTGSYWENAIASPDQWARWIVMRTNDVNDQTFKLVNKSGQLYKYTLVNSYPFADIYELKPEYMTNLHTQPVLAKQR